MHTGSAIPLATPPPPLYGVATTRRLLIVLGHTVIHCNTLQHRLLNSARSHCNTLQHRLLIVLGHTATHYNTLQHRLLSSARSHCNTLQHTATQAPYSARSLLIKRGCFPRNPEPLIKCRAPHPGRLLVVATTHGEHDSRHNVIVDTLSYNLLYESALQRE